ncbi:MAG: histidine triad nucleotide-binding protein [Patescibacteria group bacterium]|nr:histidine triad nucleotide-binding protein [Patescibacteria group bacterium]
MDCIFCKIIANEIPSPRVYESKNLIVIKDINPQAPIHNLIIPKKHIPDLNSVTEEDQEILSEILFTAKKISEIEGLKEKGYRIIANTGRDSGQLVPHLHFHFLGGKNLGPKIISD